MPQGFIQALSSRLDRLPAPPAPADDNAPLALLRVVIDNALARPGDSAPLGTDAAQRAEGVLTRLQCLLEEGTSDGLESRAHEIYPETSALETDLDYALALAVKPQAAGELLNMETYLQGATVPPGAVAPSRDELAIDRELTLARVGPAAALEHPQQIEELRASFAIFQRRYAAAYFPHHARYHAETAELSARFQRSLQALEALRLLNSIAALGAHTEPDLAADAERLRAPLVPCEISDEALRTDVETAPACEVCGITLGRNPERAALERYE